MDKEGMGGQVTLHSVLPPAREAWAASRARAEARARNVPDDLVRRAGSELNRSLVARAERLVGLELEDIAAVIASDAPQRSGDNMRSSTTLDIDGARVEVVKFQPVTGSLMAVTRYGLHFVDENGRMIPAFVDTEYDERRGGEPLGGQYLGRIKDDPEEFDYIGLIQARTALVDGLEVDENLTTIEEACGLEPHESLNTAEYQWLASLITPQVS
jgi:hypothetical protein